MKKNVSVSQVYSHNSEWHGPEFVRNALKPGKEIDVETSIHTLLKKRRTVEVTVVTLGGHKYIITCDAKRTTERTILPTVLAHEGISGPERLLFGLASLRKGDIIFLEPDVKLIKYLNDGKSGDAQSTQLLTLFVRMRVYILPDAFGMSRLVHFLYLQARHDIMEGSILLSKTADVFELASLAMQAEIGDIPGQGVDYFLLAHYLPTEQTEIQAEDDLELRKRLVGYHAQWRGLENKEAEKKFLSIVNKNPQFGHQFFVAQVNSMCYPNEVDVAVNQDGVQIWNVVQRKIEGGELTGASNRSVLPGTCRRLGLSFPWQKIEKVSYDSKQVMIRTYVACEGQVWGKPLNNFVVPGSCTAGKHQSKVPVVLSQENRIVPLFRSNSVDGLDVNPIASQTKNMLKFQSENLAKSNFNLCQNERLCGRFVTCVSIPGPSPRSETNFEPMRSRNSASTSTDASSSAGDSGVGDNCDETFFGEMTRDFSRIHCVVSDSLIANTSRLPLSETSDSVCEEDETVLEVRKSVSKILEETVQEISVLSDDFQSSKEPVENDFTTLNEASADESSQSACADWNWENESVSQSFLERFKKCGVGPERKIMNIRLVREEDDLRPWGLLISERDDKVFYVACMPYISIVAQSGLILEGDRLLQINGRNLSGLGFCDVLEAINSNRNVLEVLLSREVLEEDIVGKGRKIVENESVVQES
ncbi:unnamed protein product [Notodromas monacha]|uniref:PDZ domain-containing protein n=1 Tax=Notodromas monacha TaxID=399045 RepID=A0A7R9GI61_9CRUS|nr:unnamed protein product [Notodromas monacha]CAG0923531.1 unnamed protein product [Notodromas monacha]